MFLLLLSLPSPIHTIPMATHLTTCTMQASLKTAKYALHYQPITNTIAQQNRLLEIQKNFQKQGKRSEPVFFSSMGSRKSRKLEDTEIFDFTDSRGIKLEEKEIDTPVERAVNSIDITDCQSAEEEEEKGSDISSNSMVNKTFAPFVPSNFYTLYFWK